MSASVMIRHEVNPLSEGVDVQGRSSVEEIPVIELVNPMPGFPDLRRFALVRLDDDGSLCALRSLEDPDLRFLVTSPVTFFPDYAPLVEDDVVDQLGITDANEVLVLVVLTAGASLAETTANLRAPVLINTVTRRACQVILDDQELSVATPLLPGAPATTS